MKQRPISVKVILGLAVFQPVLAWGFYGFFFVNKPESELLSGILLTASAYTVLAIPIVISVLKQNVILLRVCLLLNVVVSVPVKAIIGIGYP